MPRFKLLIEYAGTRYSGWQIQKNARTVQGEIDRAIREVSKRARVRAVWIRPHRRRRARAAQVAHLDLYTDLPPESLRRRTTTSFPPTSTSAQSTRCRTGFTRGTMRSHAVICIRSARRRTAFGKPFVWWVREPLDVDAMRSGRGIRWHEELRRVHRRRSRREVDHVLVDRIEIVESGALILFVSRDRTSCGRWCVGLLACSPRWREATLTPADATRLVEDNPVGTAAPAALAAPAAGLFLEHVIYKGEPPPPPVAPVIAIT